TPESSFNSSCEPGSASSAAAVATLPSGAIRVQASPSRTSRTASLLANTPASLRSRLGERSGFAATGTGFGSGGLGSGIGTGAGGSGFGSGGLGSGIGTGAGGSGFG